MSVELREPPPRPPTRCERHGEETIGILSFGQQPGSGERCLFCMGDPRRGADDLYAVALAIHERDMAEYLALTARIEEIERELQTSPGKGGKA